MSFAATRPFLRKDTAEPRSRGSDRDGSLDGARSANGSVSSRSSTAAHGGPRGAAVVPARSELSPSHAPTDGRHSATSVPAKAVIANLGSSLLPLEITIEEEFAKASTTLRDELLAMFAEERRSRQTSLAEIRDEISSQSIRVAELMRSHGSNHAQEYSRVATEALEMSAAKLREDFVTRQELKDVLQLHQEDGVQFAQRCSSLAAESAEVRGDMAQLRLQADVFEATSTDLRRELEGQRASLNDLRREFSNLLERNATSPRHDGAEGHLPAAGAAKIEEAKLAASEELNQRLAQMRCEIEELVEQRSSALMAQTTGLKAKVLASEELKQRLVQMRCEIEELVEQRSSALMAHTTGLKADHVELRVRADAAEASIEELRQTVQGHLRNLGDLREDMFSSCAQIPEVREEIQSFSDRLHVAEKRLLRMHQAQDEEQPQQQQQQQQQEQQQQEQARSKLDQDRDLAAVNEQLSSLKTESKQCFRELVEERAERSRELERLRQHAEGLNAGTGRLVVSEIARAVARAQDEERTARANALQSLRTQVSARVDQLALEQQAMTNNTRLSTTPPISEGEDAVRAELQLKLTCFRDDLESTRGQAQRAVRLAERVEAFEKDIKIGVDASTRLGDVLKVTQTVTSGVEKLAERLASEAAHRQVEGAELERRLGGVERVVVRLLGENVYPLVSTVHAEQPRDRGQSPERQGPLFPDDLKRTLQRLVDKVSITLGEEGRELLSVADTTENSTFHEPPGKQLFIPPTLQVPSPTPALLKGQAAMNSSPTGNQYHTPVVRAISPACQGCGATVPTAQIVTTSPTTPISAISPCHPTKRAISPTLGVPKLQMAGRRASPECSSRADTSTFRSPLHTVDSQRAALERAVREITSQGLSALTPTLPTNSATGNSAAQPEQVKSFAWSVKGGSTSGIRQGSGSNSSGHRQVSAGQLQSEASSAEQTRSVLGSRSFGPPRVTSPGLTTRPARAEPRSSGQHQRM